MLEVLVSWLSEGPALLAIDAQLGWPLPLARGLHEHRAGQPVPGDAHDLFRRMTDRFGLSQSSVLVEPVRASSSQSR